jgi:hypothetical protein
VLEHRKQRIRVFVVERQMVVDPLPEIRSRSGRLSSSVGIAIGYRLGHGHGGEGKSIAVPERTASILLGISSGMVQLVDGQLDFTELRYSF